MVNERVRQRFATNVIIALFLLVCMIVMALWGASAYQMNSKIDQAHRQINTLNDKVDQIIDNLRDDDNIVAWSEAQTIQRKIDEERARQGFKESAMTRRE